MNAQSSIQIQGNTAQVQGYSQFLIEPAIKHEDIDENCTNCTNRCQIIVLTGVVELVAADNGVLNIIPSSLSIANEATRIKPMAPIVMGQFSPMKPFEPLRWFVSSGTDSVRPVIKISCK
jgi:hypothetical protein